MNRIQACVWSEDSACIEVTIKNFIPGASLWAAVTSVPLTFLIVEFRVVVAPAISYIFRYGGITV